MSDLLSIVVPVYNERQSLAQLHGELAAVAREQGGAMEIIFVDDGSQDDSWGVIAELAARDPAVCGIRFRRNFGKAAALDAGFQAARGVRIVTLDADLQDDPAELPRLLAALDERADVVSGWKKTRHDPWHKVVPSRVFNWLVGILTGVRLHDHNCGFKAYRREVCDDLRLYGELHRFIPVLAAARGWRVGEVEVRHRPRRYGQSKYGLTRIVKGFLDLLTVLFLTDFGHRPQHLLGSIGLLSFGGGAAGITGLSGWWVLSRLVESIPDVHLHQRALFYYSITAILLGAQFMAIGFLAELITARIGSQREPYAVCQRIDRRPTVAVDPSGETDAAR